jgi:ribokinase
MSAAAPFDVVVLGSLHLDVMVRARRPPRPGETVPGEGWAFKCGGKGGNQAVEAARQGAPARDGGPRRGR